MARRLAERVHLRRSFSLNSVPTATSSSGVASATTGDRFSRMAENRLRAAMAWYSVSFAPGRAPDGCGLRIPCPSALGTMRITRATTLLAAPATK